MRPTFRLVPHFIVPHLNNSTYGDHLHWENKKNGSFKISRIHQSSDMWDEHCIEVYKAWSIKKKLWHVDDPKKITKAKHRLITALRRNPEIEMLKKESTFYRFKLVRLDALDNTCEEDSTEQLKLHATSKNNKNEIADHSIPNDETKCCDMKNTNEFNNNEQNDYSAFSKANNNPTYWHFPLSELYDVPKTFSIIDDIVGDELYPVESKTSVISDKCCCEKLLDNYLCNQKCIWHGMPP